MYNKQTNVIQRQFFLMFDCHLMFIGDAGTCSALNSAVNLLSFLFNFQCAVYSASVRYMISFNIYIYQLVCGVFITKNYFILCWLFWVLCFCSYLHYLLSSNIVEDCYCDMRKCWTYGFYVVKWSCFAVRCTPFSIFRLYLYKVEPELNILVLMPGC